MSDLDLLNFCYLRSKFKDVTIEETNEQEQIVNTNQVEEEPSPEEDLVKEIPISFSNTGVTIAYIEQFILSCGGYELFENKSTEEIFYNYIQPTEAERNLPFNQQVSYNQVNLEKSTWYVCQSQKSNFLDVFESITNRLLTIYDEDIAYHQVCIWWDIFCQPLCVVEQPSVTYWNEFIHPNITDIGHMLIVLTTWNPNSSLYDDYKCILEITYAIEKGLEMELCMTNTQWNYFDNDLVKDLNTFYTYFVTKLLSKVDQFNTTVVTSSRFQHENNTNKKGIANNSLTDVEDGNTEESWHHEIISIIYTISSQGLSVVNAFLSDIFQEWLILYIQDKIEYLLFQYTELNESITIESINWRKMLIQIYSIHQNSIQYSDKIENLYQDSLNTSRRVLGEFHAMTIACVNELARFYRNQGKYELAEPLYVSRLSSRRKILRDDHPYTLSAMHDLALIYRCLQKYEEAEQLLIGTLDVRIRVLGTQHSDTLDTIHELTDLYRSTNQIEVLEKLYISRVATNTKSYGVDNQVTIDSKLLLGEYYISQYQYNLAQNIFEECLVYKKKTLGIQHVEVIKLMSILSSIYMAQYMYEKAEIIYLQRFKLIQDLSLRHPEKMMSPLLSTRPSKIITTPSNIPVTASNTSNMNNMMTPKVTSSMTPSYTSPVPSTPLRDLVTIPTRALPDDYPELLRMSIQELGQLYLSMKQYDKTIYYYKLLIKTILDIYGDNHEYNISSHIQLANIYKILSKYSEAESLLVVALNIQKEIYGDIHIHIHTHSLMLQLADIYCLLGQYNMALPLYEACISISEQLYTNENNEYEHDIIWDSHLQLAHFYRHQLEYDKAESIYHKILNKYEIIIGSETQEYLEIQSYLALIYRNQGKYEESKALYESIIDTCVEDIGVYHMFTLTIKYHYGVLLYHMNLKLDAYGVLNYLLESYDIIYGRSHILSIQLYHTVGTFHMTDDAYDNAMKWYIEAYSRSKTHLGIHHPCTLNIVIDFISLYEKMMNKDGVIESDENQSKSTDSLTKSKQILPITVSYQVLLEELYQIYIQAYGYNHSSTIITETKLLSYYLQHNHYPLVENMYMSQLDRFKTQSNPNLMEIISKLRELLSLYGSMESSTYEIKLSIYNEISTLIKQVYGEQSAEMLSYLEELLSFYLTNEKVEEYDSLYMTLYTMSQSIHGPDHVTTLSHMKSLILYYQSQQRYDECEPIVLDGYNIYKRLYTETDPIYLQYITVVSKFYEMSGRPDPTKPTKKKGGTKK